MARIIGNRKSMNYKKQVDDLIEYAELNEIIKILKVSDQNIFFVYF